jgi:hypothetical protein
LGTGANVVVGVGLDQVTRVRKPEVDGSTLGWEFPPQSAIEGALLVNRLQALLLTGRNGRSRSHSASLG